MQTYEEYLKETGKPNTTAIKRAWDQCAHDIKVKHHFETKKQQVLQGVSTVFREWKRYSTISQEEFLKCLEWVCLDERPRCKISRAMGLTPVGIILLDVYQMGENTFLYYEHKKFPGFSSEEFSVLGEEPFPSGNRRIILTALDAV